jgi:hypothetical protein
MSRHADFATDGKNLLNFWLVRADLEFSHSLGRQATFNRMVNWLAALVKLAGERGELR